MNKGKRRRKIVIPPGAERRTTPF